KPPLDEFRQQALQASVVVADDPALGVQLVRSSTVPFAEFRGTLAEFLDYQDTRIAHVVAESAQTAQNLSALIVALAFLITLGAALVTTQIGARLIAQPIRSITAVMHRLATGDLTVETDGLDQQDEIGAMARAVEVFRQNAIEKAQLDGELRVSEERYRLLFQHSPAGVFQYDTELRITDCNERLAAILQSTFQLLVGLDLNTLSDQSVLPALRQALAGEEGSYEGRYRATTGPARVWVSLHTTPLFDLQGRVTGGIALVEDISARKQAEQARERLIGELQEALAQVKTLGGLLPICASCKKIRDDQGYWNQIEAYIEAHSEAEFTHGICPECARRLYPESFPPSTTPGADRPA
ncbi:MAG: PAS domain S-box protein, partial [Chloroflexi bacterium]|nr:PAS domain S-box protein [Chloroflexota bacterium]